MAQGVLPGLEPGDAGFDSQTLDHDTEAPRGGPPAHTHARQANDEAHRTGSFAPAARAESTSGTFCGRRRARPRGANSRMVGSIPTARSRVVLLRMPRGEVLGFHPGQEGSTPSICSSGNDGRLVSGRPRFDSERWLDSVHVCSFHVAFFQWPRNPGSQSGNMGSIPIRDTICMGCGQVTRLDSNPDQVRRDTSAARRIELREPGCLISSAARVRVSTMRPRNATRWKPRCDHAGQLIWG